MKKRLMIATILYALLLLAVPLYSILQHNDLLSTGEPYKILVEPYDPYDPFRGRYVEISPEDPDLSWRPRNIRLMKDGQGFVTGSAKTADTHAPGYVRELRIERYYLNEKIAPLVDDYMWRQFNDDDQVYVVIRVKNGSYAIEGMFINGIPVEEYVGSPQN
jgi:uncharacterized membrane-anchored protein